MDYLAGPGDWSNRYIWMRVSDCNRPNCICNNENNLVAISRLGRNLQGSPDALRHVTPSTWRIKQKARNADVEKKSSTLTSRHARHEVTKSKVFEWTYLKVCTIRSICSPLKQFHGFYSYHFPFCIAWKEKIINLLLEAWPTVRNNCFHYKCRYLG